MTEDAHDSVRVERLVAFIELADDVLAVPWAKTNAQVLWHFQATDREGHGTWTLSGPTETELKVIALDIRNAMQPGSDLFIPRVLEDYVSLVPDDQLKDAAEQVLAGFNRIREEGMTVWNGEPLEPWRVAERWFYGSYHHRNLKDRRWLKSLDPMSRLAHRAEFLVHLGAVMGVIVDACNLITVAKERGYLADVPLVKGAETAP